MLHSNKGRSSYELSFWHQTSCRKRQGAIYWLIVLAQCFINVHTSTKVSILKRFGMKEGTMYYVMWGCRSRIIDCLGLKHPWFDIETEGRGGGGRRESASFEPKQYNESGTKFFWFSNRFVAKTAPQVYVQRDVKKMQFRCEYQKVGIYWYLGNWPSHNQS